MKLYYSTTSPFVRKCLVAAHELGLANRIDLAALRPTPLQCDAELSSQNPLNKIPVLITDDGTSLYDSAVICEYLDALSESVGGSLRLIPQRGEGAARYRVLRVQALCDGILEAAIQVFYERLHRPEALQWQPWLAGQSAKTWQGLDQLERECQHFGSTVDLGTISAAVALGWLMFRNPLGLADSWSSRLPALADWFETFAMRPSMLATAPRL